MSEGGTSGYGGAPGRAKGAMVENSMAIVAESSFCAKPASFPTKIWIFSYHNSQQQKKNRVLI